MAHGTAKRNHARALTLVFAIYTTLLQSTKAHRWLKRFAAFCHSEILQDVKQTNSSTYINTLLLQYHPCHLCYDERTQVRGGSVSGREETGWTLSRSWIR